MNVSATEKIRLGIQKGGQISWELDLVRVRGLDKAEDMEIETVELTGPDSSRIGLRAGTADVVLTDWLWVSHERSLGANFAFYPYSAISGCVAVPSDSPVAVMGDLRGKKLGVAGGGMDRNWLLLRAYARRAGIDLRTESILVFGSPQQIAEKAIEKEVDAALASWNFCAALEGRGFHSLLAMPDVAESFGATGPLAMNGFVFDGEFAARHSETLTRFLKVMRAARQLLADSPEEWVKLGPRLGTKDPAALTLYRQRYGASLARRSIAAEEADARLLFHVFAESGGRDLVGEASELDAGTFYKAGPGS